MGAEVPEVVPQGDVHGPTGLELERGQGVDRFEDLPGLEDPLGVVGRTAHGHREDPSPGHDAGRKQLESYIQLEPSDIAVLSILGELCYHTNDYQTALSYLEQYLRHQPTDYRALMLLSDCYLNMGHQDSALVGYQKVLQLEPGYQPASDRIIELGQTVNTFES